MARPKNKAALLCIIPLLVLAIAFGAYVNWALGSQHLSSATSSSSNSSSIPSIAGLEKGSIAASITPEPGSLAFNARTDEIYSLDSSASNITIVNASSMTFVGNITIPGASMGTLAFDNESDILLVPLWANPQIPNTQILEISGLTNQIVRSITVPNLTHIAVDSSTHIVYATSDNVVNAFPSNVSSSSGNLLSFDEDSGALLRNVSLPVYLLDVVTDPFSKTTFVDACTLIGFIGCTGDQLLSFDSSTLTLKSNISLPVTPGYPLALDIRTGVVYVMGSTLNATLVAINGTSSKVLFSASIGSSCDGSGGLLFADPESGDVFAGAQGANTSASIPLLITINGSTGAITSMLSANIESAIDPTGQTIYATLASSNDLNGTIVALSPSSIEEGYVNASLLQVGNCLP
jgi:hypothetical protein